MAVRTSSSAAARVRRRGAPPFGPPRGRSLDSADVSDFLRSYLTVFIFGCVAIALVGAVLGLGSYLRPDNPSRAKQTGYESGVDPVGEGWTQAEIRYYIFALLFVVFDVEAVFLFPYATRAEAYGWFGAAAMGVFIVILTLTILEAWRKKVLRWS